LVPEIVPSTLVIVNEAWKSVIAPVKPLGGRSEVDVASVNEPLSMKVPGYGPAATPEIEYVKVEPLATHEPCTSVTGPPPLGGAGVEISVSPVSGSAVAAEATPGNPKPTSNVPNPAKTVIVKRLDMRSPEVRANSSPPRPPNGGL
jgi:hypothetical protein